MNARELRPDKPIVRPHSGAPSLFLAGTIEQGKSEDWQAKAVEYFSEYSLNIYNPRNANWNSELTQEVKNKEFTKQVVWEQKHLIKSNFVIVNLLESTLSPISLMELGELTLMNSATVVVCCPRNFWRRGNVEVMCALGKMHLYETLEDGLAHIRVLLESI